jgi:hypothetical protein
MARFNAANARLMAARSVAVRKAAEAERTASPAPAPLQATPAADTDAGISVSRVRARLETLDALMSKAKTDREWDNLSRAFDRLFRVWCVLTKTPGPGNRRPGREREDRRPAAWRIECQPAPMGQPAPAPVPG